MASQASPENRVGPPQQGRSRRARDRLLIAAERVLDEAGPEGFSIAAVASSANVSVGGVYRRFSDKQELVRAVQDRMLVRWEETVTKELDHAAPGIESVVTTLVSVQSRLLRTHAGLVGSFWALEQADPVLAARGLQNVSRVAEAFKDHALRDRESITHADPELAVRVAYFIALAPLLRHARILRLGGRAEFSWTEIQREVTSACIAYLVSQPGASK